MNGAPRRLPGGGLRRRLRDAWRALCRQRGVATVVALLRGTVEVCLRYRVTGLAAEAGFFALLSLPPLVLGLAATAAWVGRDIGGAEGAELRSAILDATEPFLTQQVVSGIVIPTLDDAFADTRVDLISLGFLLSLWSGSRALNVYVDTISIMYGLGGHRGILRTRALAFSLYVLVLVLGALTVPLLLVGPTLLGDVVPGAFEPLLVLYWPVVTLLGVALLATLYHISTPVRTAWRWDLPGALLALVIWVLASFVLRVVISASVGGASIYGPLATPIVVLIWLYLLAIAVLIGAALNATVDRRWPHAVRAAARAEGSDASTGSQLTPVRDAEEEDQEAAGPDRPERTGPPAAGPEPENRVTARRRDA